MERFDPQLLAAWTGGTWLGDPPATALTGFAIDSRRAAPGDMFVALKTEQRDGHAYLAAAQAAGAAAALACRGSSPPRPTQGRSG